MVSQVTLLVFISTIFINMLNINSPLGLLTQHFISYMYFFPHTVPNY